MSNHVHVIFSREENLSSAVRDFKKFTTKAIIKAIKEMHESRRDWMLFQFGLRGKMNKRNTNYQFWTQENHPIQLVDSESINRFLNYIHEPSSFAASSRTPYKINNKVSTIMFELG
jgi:putative transposase